MAPEVAALIVCLGGLVDHTSTTAALKRGGVESNPFYVSSYSPEKKALTTALAAGSAYVLTRKHKKLGLTFALGLTSFQVTVALKNDRKAR